MTEQNFKKLMGAKQRVSFLYPWNYEIIHFVFRLQRKEIFFVLKILFVFDKVFLCDCYFYLHKTINISCCLINRLQCREKHFTTTNQKQIHENYFCLLFMRIQICGTDDCTKVRLSGRRQDPEDTFYSVPWELTLGRR